MKYLKKMHTLRELLNTDIIFVHLGLENMGKVYIILFFLISVDTI